MSNPYDPNQRPRHPNEPPTGTAPPPYGEAMPAPQFGDQGVPPYGGAPYGAPVPGGEAPKGTDAVSITGFVLSLTCCLSFVGVILGFVGLGRTKGGKRKARWAAIALSPSASRSPSPRSSPASSSASTSRASSRSTRPRAGMCVDINDDNDGVVLFEKECDEPHDGEIIYAGDAGDDAATLESSDATSVCVSRIDEAAAGIVVSGDYDLNALLEDPDDVADDDRFVCYIEPTDGDKVSEKLLP